MLGAGGPRVPRSMAIRFMAATWGGRFPPFARLSRMLTIAPAPLIGGMRVFTEPDLEALGRRFGVQVSILSRAVCFRVPTAPLNREAVLTPCDARCLGGYAYRPGGFQSRAGARRAHSISYRKAVASGVIRFNELWRGEVVAGNRRFLIWARTKITAPVSRIVAVENLKPGVPIQAQQVATESIDGFPALVKTGLPTIGTVAGMMPLRSIAAGSEIRSENLARPLVRWRGATWFMSRFVLARRVFR